MLELVTGGWTLIGYQCFYRYSAGENRSESNSNDSVLMCSYRYSCGVDSAIF